VQNNGQLKTSSAGNVLWYLSYGQCRDVFLVVKDSRPFQRELMLRTVQLWEWQETRRLFDLLSGTVSFHLSIISPPLYVSYTSQLSYLTTHPQCQLLHCWRQTIECFLQFLLSSPPPPLTTSIWNDTTGRKERGNVFSFFFSFAFSYNPFFLYLPLFLRGQLVLFCIADTLLDTLKWIVCIFVFVKLTDNANRH